MSESNVPGETRDVFERAGIANPHWLRSAAIAAKTMGSRRKKYSGSGDPYLNFILTARLKGVEVADVFRDYLGLKLARHMVDAGNFGDESSVDTDIDMANYALLSAGWKMRDAGDRLQAMLACGEWVEVDALLRVLEMTRGDLIDAAVVKSLGARSGAQAG